MTEQVEGSAATPATLAAELGVESIRVRRVLRAAFPRNKEDHGSSWHLTPEQQAEVRRQLSEANSENDDARWLEFADLAADIIAEGRVNLEEQEVAYKRRLAEKISQARAACEADEQAWPSEVMSALRTGTNLLHYITLSRFEDAITTARDAARGVLMGLWQSGGSRESVVELQRFLKASDSKMHPGGVVALASNLLMGAGDFAPFRSVAIASFARRVGVDVPADSKDAGARWESFLDLVDEAADTLREKGIEVRDRIDAQSYIWLVSEWDVDSIASGDLAERVRRWRGEDVTFERHNRIDAVSEDAGWRVLRAGLMREDSPLTGGPSVWTRENAEDVVRRISENPLEGSDIGFDAKIQIQLDGADPEVVQLVAEFQLVRQLPTANIRLPGATKALKMYSDLAGQNWPMSEWLEEAFGHWVFGGGMNFNRQQWMHVVLTAKFVLAWGELDEPEKERVLADPWGLLDFAEGVGGDTADEKHMRMVLCYLAWPNYFHPITKAGDIQQIRSAFRRHLPNPTGHRNAEIQRDLYVIQQALEERHGGPVNFYVAPFEEMWRKVKAVPEPDVPNVPRPELDFASRAAEIADGLHMDRAALARMGRVLEQRRQVVFYGPPGTGKTYTARRLAAALAGDDAEDSIRLVQFHPSYSYEDFVEGFRPKAASDGTAAFALLHGPLRKLAASAEANLDQPHFLIIDEMNRGNLAKVFGELYFLLEYRDQDVFLQYSPSTPFRLPENLYIIGTMNTADRSIGLVDAAIRRRFAFMEFHPETSPVEGVLERYLESHGYALETVGLLRRLNERISERDLRIGPSYLMRPSAHEDAGLDDVWEYDILPLLYEHFHGHKSVDEVRREFSLEALRAGDVDG